MNIVAFNPKTDDLEKTYLSIRTIAGEDDFTVKNVNGFVAGKKVLIGEMSRERSEILTVDSVAGQIITFDSVALFPHDADDPLYILEYDQVRFLRSTTGSGGTYTTLADVDIDVDNADDKTEYEDPNPLTNYYYKIAYYNSVTDLESEHTIPIPSTGYIDGSAGQTILAIAKEVGDKDFITFDVERWLEIMNDINKDMITQSKRPYRFLRTLAVLNIDISDSDDSVDFPDNFWKVDYTEVNTANPTSPETYRPKKVSPSDMRWRHSQTPLASNDVYEIAYDDFGSKLLFNPTALTDRIGAFNLWYYRMFAKLTAMTDLLETPNDLIYKLGMKREWYFDKADSDDKYLKRATDYDKRYNGELMKLQREKGVEAGGPQGLGPDQKSYPQFGGRRYRQ